MLESKLFPHLLAYLKFSSGFASAGVNNLITFELQAFDAGATLPSTGCAIIDCFTAVANVVNTAAAFQVH